MAIGVLNVPILSPEQANPIMTGMQMGNQVVGQGLQNQQQMIQNQYLPQTLQQALIKAQLENKILQPQAQFAPQMTEADLALKQAMAPYYQSQTAETYSKIPVNEAQAGLLKAQTQFFPVTAAGGYLRGYGDYLKGMYLSNPAMWASRFQNNPGIQNILANNPELADKVANLQINSMLGAGMPTPGMPGLNGAPLPGMGGGQPQSAGMLQSGASSPNIGNMLGNGLTQQGMIPQTPNLSPLLSPDDIANYQDALGSKVQKDTQTPQILNQRQYDASAQNMISNIDPKINSIVQYAGLRGHAALFGDRMAASLGGKKDDINFQNYNNFTTSQMPLFANEVGRALGNHATNVQKEQMLEIANPVTWDTNPQLALSSYNALKQALAANRKALTQSPQQILSALKQEGTDNASGQVGQMGQQNIQIPQFNSQAEFKAWIKTLSPQQQAQVRQMMAQQRMH